MPSSFPSGSFPGLFRPRCVPSPLLPHLRLGSLLSGYSGGSGYGYSDLIYSGYGGHVNNAYGSPNGGFLQSGNIAPTSVYKSVAYGGGYGGSSGGGGGYGGSLGGGY